MLHWEIWTKLYYYTNDSTGHYVTDLKAIQYLLYDIYLKVPKFWTLWCDFGWFIFQKQHTHYQLSHSDETKQWANKVVNDIFCTFIRFPGVYILWYILFMICEFIFTVQQVNIFNWGLMFIIPCYSKNILQHDNPNTSLHLEVFCL